MLGVVSPVLLILFIGRGLTNPKKPVVAADLVLLGQVQIVI